MDDVFEIKLRPVGVDPNVVLILEQMLKDAKLIEDFDYGGE